MHNYSSLTRAGRGLLDRAERETREYCKLFTDDVERVLCTGRSYCPITHVLGCRFCCDAAAAILPLAGPLPTKQ